MKPLIISIIIITLLNSCAPKIGSKILSIHESLKDSEFVLVLQPKDEFYNDGIKIGSIRAKDDGLSVNCTYYEILDELKRLARHNGANVIKITKRIQPNQVGTCVRLDADLYKVPNFRVHEKIIEWSENRKLVEEDFKGVPGDQSFNTVGLTHSQIQVNSNRVLFKKTKIFTTAEFYCDKSWIKEGYKNNSNILAHEQGHFDITEIYRRKLEKKLRESILTPFNMEKNVKSIFGKLFSEYKDYQELYDSETMHGIDKMQQEHWQKLIAIDLRRLSEFKNP